jgi:hypothetical protein
MSASTLIGLENKFRVLFQYFQSNFAENSSVFTMNICPEQKVTFILKRV